MADLTLEQISELMRDIDFAVLTTHTDNGAIAGRPMSNNREVDFDGDSHFFALDSTRSVTDIHKDPQVGLSYQGRSGLIAGKPIFITIEGRAELIQDKARFADHWTKDLDRWFEQGIDTPGLTLIKVKAQRLHYWNGGDEGELKLEGARSSASPA